jgi:hypothetical protein
MSNWWKTGNNWTGANANWANWQNKQEGWSKGQASAQPERGSWSWSPPGSQSGGRNEWWG